VIGRKASRRGASESCAATIDGIVDAEPTTVNDLRAE
jgi:hypothetical protein